MIIHRLAKDVVIYGGSDFATKILTFVAFPIVAAALSPKGFGALELLLTIMGLLGVVVNCGLNNAVQRFYWDKDTLSTQQPAIVTSGLVAQLIFGVTAVIIGALMVLIFFPRVQTQGWPFTWIALVAALFVMALSQWSQYILDVTRLHFAPWRFFAIALISRLATVSFGLIAIVFWGLGIDGFLVAQAVVLLLVLPMAIWLIRKDVKLAWFDINRLKELVNFGYPFIFVGLAYWLFGSTDRWMLASMTSVEEVGIYSVAFRFASIVLFVSIAFGQAWSPIAIKIQTDHPEEYRAIFGEVLLLLFFLMLAVGGAVALFSGELINFIMPAEFITSSLPLSILCFGIVLQATQQVTAIGISIEKKTHLFAYIAWATAAVNFVLNWLLIPAFGATGAAWATLISYLILTISYTGFTQRLHPIIIPWGRLFCLLTLGAVIATVAVIMVADAFSLLAFSIKFGVLAAVSAIGWQVLPLGILKKI